MSTRREQQQLAVLRFARRQLVAAYLHGHDGRLDLAPTAWWRWCTGGLVVAALVVVVTLALGFLRG